MEGMEEPKLGTKALKRAARKDKPINGEGLRPFARRVLQNGNHSLCNAARNWLARKGLGRVRRGKA